MPEPTKKADLIEIKKRLDKIITGNQNNIILVQNPDIDCDEMDSMEGWSHSDYFEWKFDGRPHRVAPGKTRRMPAWLALHYAKHLADHMLSKLDRPTNDAHYRPIVLSKILLDIDEFFEEEDVLTEGQKAEREVAELNTPISQTASEFGGGGSMELATQDVGKVTHPVMGELKEAKRVKIAKALRNEEMPSREKMIDEANLLDIELKGDETNEQLFDKIRNF